ncbi:zinc-binding dehydrogenase, partial [Streptomyces niveus]
RVLDDGASGRGGAQTARFPLAEAARALRTVEDGHALGKIVIEVAP